MMRRIVWFPSMHCMALVAKDQKEQGSHSWSRVVIPVVLTEGHCSLSRLCPQSPLIPSGEHSKDLDNVVLSPRCYRSFAVCLFKILVPAHWIRPALVVTRNVKSASQPIHLFRFPYLRIPCTTSSDTTAATTTAVSTFNTLLYFHIT